MQHDLKRLLAYHSVENIGIIFMGLGLSMIFIGTGHTELGVLGLLAGLYHTVNHALFKSLLFLGAGSILQQTHERDIEHLGGLIRRMPKTAVIFLIGCISISALPPFNGFVSEWLTFQTALQVSTLESGVLRSLIPVTAAMLALSGALAAACFVKVYGVTFLGQPRTRHASHAHEIPHLGMHAGPALLAALCALFGILPTPVLSVLEQIPKQLLGQGLPGASRSGWLWLTPVAPEVASYAAPLVLLGILLAWGLAYALLHPHGQSLRRDRPWDCGSGPLTARMQYTSASFSMPLRRIFRPIWQIQEVTEIETEGVQGLRVTGIRYHLAIADHLWSVFYEPIAAGVQTAARQVARIQTGSLRTYLAYSFLTLVILLWLIT
jgi:NADH:ubiquinone oxidoreductase subunit 5 (subunit L)/multisubunit Na+/H+ antiporter MnhA subunit